MHVATMIDKCSIASLFEKYQRGSKVGSDRVLTFKAVTSLLSSVASESSGVGEAKSQTVAHRILWHL